MPPPLACRASFPRSDRNNKKYRSNLCCGGVRGGAGHAMTIDSSWLVAFKREHPHAFRPSAPFRYKAAFVDGQIKLMQVVSYV